MSDGNGHSRVPTDVHDLYARPWSEGEFPAGPPVAPKQSIWLPLILFLLTVISTLSVGYEFARSYAQDEQPFTTSDNLLRTFVHPLVHPHLLLLGIPFSFTLMTILLAHELGHYFACRIYGIDASYPYFLPAPTLIGTFGAFIRIRSPIMTRRALFDVGIAGPVVGFIFAVPAMAYAIATSKILPGTIDNAAIVFGNPPLMRMFIAYFHHGVDPNWVLLHPVGRAAWVGLFVTALNLLPVWQLDGGHILYSLTSRDHFRISFIVCAILIAMGHFAALWYVWGGALLVLSFFFRHPPLMNRWEPLNATRKMWALAALLIFLLCFTPTPLMQPPPPSNQARLTGSTSTSTAESGISLATQKSRQAFSASASAERCGDFKTN
jgi:Zn-dependent protease